jgi:2-methylcitrate dehydratase PrpD
MPAAVLLNGTFIQGFELDDYHFLAPIHSNALVLPAILGSVDVLGGVSGRDFLRAGVAGYEVGPRVGMALNGLQMLSRGWHSGAVFGTHAAAAAAGALHRLDAAGFEDALGMAGTQSGGLMAAQFGAMVKRMHHGFSARNGLYAARLAAGGYTGIKQVFEREYGGFLSTFGEGHSPDETQIVRQLGEVWETDRISVKPYAAMTMHHSSIDAIAEMRGRRDFDADEVTRVEVGIGHAAFHHGWWELRRPITETDAQMHIGYSIAVAMLDRAASIAQYAPDRINSDDVWAFLPRVDVRHDASIDTLPRQEQLRARMSVTLTDGTVLECEVPAPRGHHTRPLSNGDIVDKFRALTADLVDAVRRDAIENAVLGIEDMADARELTALLAGEVPPLFG